MVTSEEIKRKLEEKRRAKEEVPSQPRNIPPTPEPKIREPVPEEEITEEETVKHCPNCDVQYTGDTNFCPDCGSKLEEYQPPVGEEEALEVAEPEFTESEMEPEVETPEIEEKPVDSFAAVRMDYTGDLMVVTSNYIPGYKAVETLGFVYGLTVRSRGVGGQIGAGIRSVFGGEIKEYVKMMEQARNEALHRMVDHARSMGANAIISSRFDSDEISDIMQEILAYGTAVIVEKEEKE